MSGQGPTIKGTVDIDSSGADQGAQKFAQDAKQIEEAASGMSESVAAGGAGFQKLGEESTKAATGVKDMSSATESVKGSVGDLAQSTVASGVGMQKLGDESEKAATGLKSAGDSAKGVGGNVAEVGTSSSSAGAGVEKLGSESEKTGSSLKSVGKGAEESHMSLLGMLSSVANVVSAIVQLVQVAAMFFAAITKSADAADNMNRALVNLTGSATKAADIMKKVQQSTAAQAFGTEGIDKVVQHLMMMGKSSDDALKEVQKIADGIAAMGGSADKIEPVITKIEAIGKQSKVTSDDMNALVKDDFDSWGTLATGLGITTDEARKKVQAGAISGHDAQLAMMRGLNEYAGASQAKAESLSAEWGRLGEHMSQAFKPLVDFLAKAIGGLNQVIEGTSKLNDIMKTLADTVKGVGDALSHAFALSAQLSSSVSIVGHASGIIDSPSTHIATVGEDGPETMIIPQGASILPNGSSPFSGGGANTALSTITGMGSSMGAPQTIVLQVVIGTDTIAQQIIPLIAPQIRTLIGGRR